MCVVFCVFVLMFSVYVYCCVLWRVESLCLERGLQTRLQTLHSLQHCSTQHRVIITSAADLITNICTTVWYNIHQPPLWILLTTNYQRALSNVSLYIHNCNSVPCCAPTSTFMVHQSQESTGCLYKLSTIKLVWGPLKCTKWNFYPVHVFLHFQSFCLVVLQLILASKSSELEQFKKFSANYQFRKQ